MGLSIHHLNKAYDIPQGKLTVIHDVSFELPDAGMCFFLGKSGSGKTTMMNLLAGLDNPDNGEIFCGNENIVTMSERELDGYRNSNIGIIFQDYYLIDSLTVEENISLALELHRMESSVIRAKVEQILSYVELSGLEKRKVTDLSGGQRQRVAIARALVKNPQIVFADEPTGNLDSNTSEQIFSLLKKASKKCLIVVISHDEESAAKYGDVIFRISNGRISGENHTNKEYCFSVSLTTCGEEKNIKCSSIEELNAIINQEIEKCENVNLSIQRNKIIVSDEVETEKCEPKGEGGQKVGVLSAKRKSRFAWHNLLMNPLRFVFVILLFSLSLFLLMSSLHISRFNRKTVIADYLSDYHINCVFPFFYSSYENSYGDRLVKEVSGGAFVYETLKDIVAEDQIVKTVSNLEWGLSLQDYSEEEIFKIPTYDCCVRFFLETNVDVLGFECKYGCNTIDDDQIIITDYLASVLFHSENAVGKHLNVCGRELTVSGILDTDYVNYNYGLKKKFNKDTIYTTFLGEHIYEVAVLTPGFLSLCQNDASELELSCSNFVKSANDYQYYNTRPLIYSANSFVKSAGVLQAGRMPQSENEIVISTKFYDEFFRNIEYSILGEPTDYADVVGKKYSYRDNLEDCLNHYYSEAINMYDYSPVVTIVGVMDTCSFETGIHADIILTDSLYSRIRNDYYEKSLVLEYGVLYPTGNEQIIVDDLSDNGLDINEPSIRTVNAFNDSIKSIKSILAIVLFAMMCLSVLLLFSFINYSIHVNQKQIGILRAIGTSRTDTCSIFVLEAMIITAISLLLSLLFDFFLMQYSNRIFEKSLPINPFEIIVPNGLLIALTIVITCVVAAGASWIPIRELSKKKPIEIIRY